jgi:hypothetical protein
VSRADGFPGKSRQWSGSPSLAPSVPSYPGSADSELSALGSIGGATSVTLASDLVCAGVTNLSGPVFPSRQEKLSRTSNRDDIDRLMDRAKKAHTPKEANAAIDALGKYGEDAVAAITEVIENTRFEEVRLHGLEVIKGAKRDDTQF